MKSIRAVLAALAVLAVTLAAPVLAQADRDVPQAPEPHVYEVDTLNAGLAPVSEQVELDTPQALLESFLQTAYEQDWERAAHMLDLSDIAQERQAERGPQLAQRMFTIVNRAIALDWAALPDRPDAVDVRSSSDAPMSGAQRRHITIARLPVGERIVPVSISRVQPPDGEPVWLFSRQTVGNLPGLYTRYGPTAFEQWLPEALRKQAFWTLAWWEVIAFPLMLLVAFLAGFLTYKAIGRWKKRLEDKNSVLDNILKAVQIPATLLALAGTFALIRSTVLRFSGPVEAVMTPLQLTLVVIAIGAIILAVIETVLDFATERNVEEIEKPENEDSRDFFTQASAVRRIFIVLIMVAGLGIVLVQSSLTETLGFSLLAGAGVVGLVIAFAARRVLGDIMASLQIAFARTARIGDAVQYEGQWCYVEKIGFTHLRLRTWDERRVMAPVAEFVGSSFENWTKQDPSLIMRVPLWLDHRADIPALREALEEFVSSDDDVIDPEDAKLEVIDHSATAMIARCVARAKDPKVGWAMHCRLREHMLAAASRLEAGRGNEPAPAFLPREREVRMDLAVEDEVD